ncbi:alkaline phosphatase PhoX [Longitalea luteola]|uniref:alkaline phosphatase PhoX n=1 Tax=Longitalea luteola TaxID=2812563 RepID=UPI001A97539A|nr:alkaline phosphatase PhoX [Longitalea luteola]
MKKLLTALALPLVFLGCDKNDDNDNTEKPEFRNRSNAEALMTIDPAFASSVTAYTLISSSDTIPGHPNFVYGGAPDGQGFLKNPDGSGYIMVTNHENTFAISRVYLDKKLNPVKGEYIVNTDGGMFRLCSGSLATPEEHGFPKTVFLSTGESNPNAMTHAIDPIGAANPADNSRVKKALGKFSGENAVPLAKDAYHGKTVIILGEDASNGQVYLYVSNTPGDLDNGKLYVLRRTDLNQIETAMTKGNTYDVEFVEVPDAANLSGADIENLNSSLKSIQFARVEDLDYQKGGGAKSRELYFVATGVATTPEKTHWGRVYHLTMNANDPLKGKLSIIEDGDLNGGKDIINPDNLCVTENYVYIQEDGDSYWTGATHNSLVWQHDIASGTKKVFIDLKNKTLGGTKYNPANDQRFGQWEFGAMIDISKDIDVTGTFLINIHSHSWVEGTRFLNPSKATSVQPNAEGGQTLILTGVPR